MKLPPDWKPGEWIEVNGIKYPPKHPIYVDPTPILMHNEQIAAQLTVAYYSQAAPTSGTVYGYTPDEVYEYYNEYLDKLNKGEL